MLMIFYVLAKKDLEDQESNLTDSRVIFSECSSYFLVKPKPGDQEVNPSDFFSLWASFCTDFKDLWKREQQKIMKQKWVITFKEP